MLELISFTIFFFLTNHIEEEVHNKLSRFANHANLFQVPNAKVTGKLQEAATALTGRGRSRAGLGEQSQTPLPQVVTSSNNALPRDPAGPSVGAGGRGQVGQKCWGPCPAWEHLLCTPPS